MSDDLDEYNIENLSEKLRKECNCLGRERNPQKSAKTLHKLANAYWQQANECNDKYDTKIALIRSAVLFNAAIVRKPDNVHEIKADLRKLCSHVLELAIAQNKNADLVDGAKQIFHKVVEMRNTVRTQLKEVKESSTCGTTRIKKLFEMKKITLVRKIQTYVFTEYSAIMKKIMELSISVMGVVPNQTTFALVGMGSLARREITPYSDFENIIILEDGVEKQDNYEKILEYFRWVTVIFQLIVVNMGETIIPTVSLPFINDPDSNDNDWFYDGNTTRGISFDGMIPHACKTPLGRNKTKHKPWRTELIKPVVEMLKYLDNNENLKNGYHLADILTKTCFVFGNQEVYDMFQEGVQLALESPNAKEDFYHQTKEDATNYNFWQNYVALRGHEKINLKKMVYRSTSLFATALIRAYDIVADSTFDAIDKLPEEVDEQLTRHDIKYMLALACKVRLKAYMSENAQVDLHPNVVMLEKGNKKKWGSIISDMLGLEDAVKMMQTAIKLQDIALDKLNRSTESQIDGGENKVQLDKESEELLQRSYICLALSGDEEALFYLNKIKKITKSKTFENIDDTGWSLTKLHFLCVAQIYLDGRQFNDLDKFCLENKDKQHLPHTECFWHYYNGKVLYSKECYRQALLQFEKAEQASQGMETDVWEQNYILAKAECLCKLELPEVAHDCFEVVLKFSDIDDQPEDLREAANCCKPAEALQKTEEALKILKEETTCSEEMVADLLSEISLNAKDLNMDEKFKECLVDELDIRNKMFDKEKDVEEQIYILFEIAECQKKLHQSKQSNENYEKIIKQVKIKKNAMNKKAISADDHNMLANCYQRLDKHEDASKHFYDEISLLEKETQPNNLVEKREDFAHYLHLQHKDTEADEQISEVLKLFEDSLKEETELEQKVNLLYDIGYCYFDMQEYKKALDAFQHEDFKQGYDIPGSNYQTVLSQNHEYKYHFWVGKCLFNLMKYNDAIQHFKKCLEILSKSELGEEKIAETQVELGFCYLENGNLDQALISFDKASSILYLHANDNLSIMFEAKLGRGKCYMAKKMCQVALEELSNAMKVGIQDRKQKDEKHFKKMVEFTKDLFDSNLNVAGQKMYFDGHKNSLLQLLPIRVFPRLHDCVVCVGQCIEFVLNQPKLSRSRKRKLSSQ